MRYVYFFLGWVFFIMGFIGVFVPLLPTTPFLILSAGCFSKSSERFYNWLLDLPYMGAPLRDWKLHRMIRLRAKWLATILIGSAVGYVWFFSPVVAWVKAIMLLVCGSVLIYIWSQKSTREQKNSECR